MRSILHVLRPPLRTSPTTIRYIPMHKFVLLLWLEFHLIIVIVVQSSLLLRGLLSGQCFQFLFVLFVDLVQEPLQLDGGADVLMVLFVLRCPGIKSGHFYGGIILRKVVVFALYSTRTQYKAGVCRFPYHLSVDFALGQLLSTNL